MISRIPHPDVATARSKLLTLATGESLVYAEAARALGQEIDDPEWKRRFTAARHQLRRDGIVIECGDKCFVRLDGVAILTRHTGRERKALCRKARRAAERLAAIDVVALPKELHAEFFAERTINNVVFQATGAQTKQKVLAAAKVSMATLPMDKALKVLSNGNA